MSADRLENQCYWKYLLEETEFEAASVTSFRSAPLSSSWNFFVEAGMLVEVQNSSYSCSDDDITYWWASVVRVQGYIVKLRYLGYGDDSSSDFWMNIASRTGVVCGIDYSVHPVGWCLKNEKRIEPPKDTQVYQSDWQTYAMNELSNRLALQSDLPKIFQSQIRSKFKQGMKLEAVDAGQTGVLSAAIVQHVIGPRIKVLYTEREEFEEEDTPCFWFHESSSMIHPVGWANLHGQHIRSTKSYYETCLNKILTDSYSEDDAPVDCFMPLQVPEQLEEVYDKQELVEGMKLEFFAHHNPDVMSIGVIRKILRNFYLMIEADDGSAIDEKNQMCYHASSSSLYPAGYAQMAKIKLRKPAGYENRVFCWKEYLSETKSTPVPANLFFKNLPDHGFAVGEFVEAVDLLSPGEIGVARIERVVDRLLLIHFEGFSCDYDQWVDCESPDIYPIGWCHCVGYTLSEPGGSWKKTRRKFKAISKTV